MNEDSILNNLESYPSRIWMSIARDIYYPNVINAVHTGDVKPFVLINELLHEIKVSLYTDVDKHITSINIKH